MPLASAGNVLFPVTSTTAYGRKMIEKQSRMHHKLVGRAGHKVEARVKPIFMKQLTKLHNAKRHLPNYSEMRQRADDDIVMANLIRDAHCACEHRIDGHVMRFRDLRQKYPNHLPSYLEQHEMEKTMQAHEKIIRKTAKTIDNEPPQRALHHLKAQSATAYTLGGFPRSGAHSAPRKRRKKRRKHLLPGRRTVNGDYADEYAEYAEGDFEEDFISQAGRTVGEHAIMLPAVEGRARSRPPSRQPRWSPRGAAHMHAGPQNEEQRPSWALPEIATSYSQQYTVREQVL